MNSVLQSIGTSWTPARVIYLIIGAMLAAQAVQAHNRTFGLVGGLFMFQSITNTGCCGAGFSGKKIGNNAAAPKTLEETEYTEVK